MTRPRPDTRRGGGTMARKVLFYTHAFGGGGAEIVFSRLADAFAEAGDDVIFAADHLGPSDIRDRPNLRHVVLGAKHLSAAWRLGLLLGRDKPDASFSALGAQNLKHLVAALLAGRSHRCVLGYHGFAVAEPKLLSRMSFLATPLLTRLAARTICVSDILLQNIRQSWRASRSRTLRIYNPVPAAPERVARAYTSLQPPLIIGCGRLVPGKRYTELVAAFARVRPDTTRLAILGEGPERANIEASITRHGLADRIEMPGAVSNMSEWYGRATCLAISSESESFGLTAAEALAHGLPVVSTDCGGPAEILGHGQFGRLVLVGDTAALATALTETLADPGADAPRRERAAHFSIDAAYRAYADLIDALPQGRRSAPRASAS